MKPLQLVRKTTISSRRINLQNVVPAALSQLSIDAISRISIPIGDSTCPLGELFSVVEGDRDSLTISGDLADCDRVASSMQSGVLRVDGRVGNCLASQMSGGTVKVSGNAGNEACSTLRGGNVFIDGNVGDYACGGNMHGMRGGQVVITGNTGKWLASRMRRGTVCVHGNVGPGTASRLIAGTLVICGHFTGPIGAGMQRGTVLLDGAHLVTFDRDAEQGPEPNWAEIPGFTPPALAELSFLPILLQSLSKAVPDPFLEEKHKLKSLRSVGDRAAGGQGEILWLLSSAAELPQHFPW